MSDYKAKNYIDNGILDFILDICSPEQWHPEKLKKENIPLLTPVENVYPPMINPPYSFEDIISLNSMKIFDIKGSMVAHKYLYNLENNFKLDLSHLESGIYFMNFESDKGEIVKRFIKK